MTLLETTNVTFTEGAVNSYSTLANNIINKDWAKNRFEKTENDGEEFDLLGSLETPLVLKKGYNDIDRTNNKEVVETPTHKVIYEKVKSLGNTEYTATVEAWTCKIYKK